MSILEGPLVFVDIETNGLDHIRGRVIEVAAIRVEAGVVTQTFRSLIDPETPLPYYITNLTGIKTDDLKGAPMFHEIADELAEVLQGAVFVAHNVRFDYSFLKQEFARVGKPFLPKQLCTVKLSRALHPHEKGHKLADLIQRHGFTFSARHRAYDDAAVLWQFVQYARKQFPPEQVEAAIALQLRSPSVPKDLEPELVRNLPEAPGVYIFEDAAHQPLYIGKSINIKKRVMSHFGRDHAENKEFKIAQAIKHIRTEQTPGELSALLLESRLIKELQPLHNRKLRKTDLLLLARESSNALGYQTIVLEEAATIDPSSATDIVAVYPRRGAARQSLETICKTYDLCPKLMGIEKTNGACFSYQLRKCQGACVGKEAPGAYNQRLQEAFARQRIQAWPYRGAVLVEEKMSPEFHGIVVDQWCVLAEITQDAYCDPVVSIQTKHFDLDTYKILQTFLTAKLDKLKIQKIDLEQLQLSTVST
jgi:DNA polymerase-3 subunit epsilon